MNVKLKVRVFGRPMYAQVVEYQSAPGGNRSDIMVLVRVAGQISTWVFADEVELEVAK